jgi:hypothetical protein
LRRSSSQRAKSTAMQTRIDKAPWLTKSKLAKTAIGKERKDKEKKAKVTDKAVLGSDESTPSLDEGQSLPYQESNLSTSASFDDDDEDSGG